jgi:hypothetical protein
MNIELPKDLPPQYQDLLAHLNFGKDIIARGKVREVGRGAYQRALETRSRVEAMVASAGWQSPTEMAAAINEGMELFGSDQGIQNEESLAEFFPKEKK